MIPGEISVTFYTDTNVDENNNADNVSSDVVNDASDVVNDVVNDTSDVVNNSANNGVSKAQMKILQQMRTNPNVTAKQISEAIGINTRNVQVHIRSLKSMGIVERVGSAKKGLWIVKAGG